MHVSCLILVNMINSGRTLIHLLKLIIVVKIYQQWLGRFFLTCSESYRTLILNCLKEFIVPNDCWEYAFYTLDTNDTAVIL